MRGQSSKIQKLTKKRESRSKILNPHLHFFVEFISHQPITNHFLRKTYTLVGTRSKWKIYEGFISPDINHFKLPLLTLSLKIAFKRVKTIYHGGK